MSVKSQIIQYRNDNKETRVSLGTVLGELDRITKDPTDEQCYQVIKKMMEANLLTGMLEENKLLEKFLPQQLDKYTINELILLNRESMSTLGTCMNYFKTNFLGKYNGKLVSECYNKIYK